MFSSTSRRTPETIARFTALRRPERLGVRRSARFEPLDALEKKSSHQGLTGTASSSGRSAGSSIARRGGRTKTGRPCDPRSIPAGSPTRLAARRFGITLQCSTAAGRTRRVSWSAGENSDRKRKRLPRAFSRLGLGASRVREISVAFFFGNTFGERRRLLSQSSSTVRALHFA